MNDNEPIMTQADRDLLGSILEKDNDGIRQEMKNATLEEVFKIGYEGGGLEVIRHTTSDRKQYFVTSGSNMAFDDDDNEEWVQREDDPTASFEGSLVELGFGTNILYIKPLFVHSDYYDAVRQYIEKLLAQVTIEERERMGEYVPADADEWFARLRRF